MEAGGVEKFLIQHFKEIWTLNIKGVSGRKKYMHAFVYSKRIWVLLW